MVHLTTNPRELALLREAHYRVTHESPAMRAAWLAEYEEWYRRRIAAGLRYVPLLPVKAAPNPLEGWSGWRGYGPPSGRIA